MNIPKQAVLRYAKVLYRREDLKLNETQDAIVFSPSRSNTVRYEVSLEWFWFSEKFDMLSAGYITQAEYEAGTPA